MLSSIRERADVFFRSVKIRDDAASHKGGLYALYRKELADHLRSRRFLIILALILLTSCASIYGALSGLSEAVEAIEPGPVEGIRATGANKLEEILYGVLPQVMPLLISYSLYRFESNVRSATVVGMVGAGGIGVTLWEAIRGFQFQQTCALMVLIIVTVSLLDFLSQRLRKHFI